MFDWECNREMIFYSDSAFEPNRPQIRQIKLIFTDFLSENQKKSEKICSISQICGLLGSYAELLIFLPFIL
jgi:hypothetical protein